MCYNFTTTIYKFDTLEWKHNLCESLFLKMQNLADELYQYCQTITVHQNHLWRNQDLALRDVASEGDFNL